MTERPEPRILRIAAVYVGLVIVPSLAALAFLDAHRGKGRHLTAAATSTSARSGTAFMQLLLAVAIIVAACAAMGWLMRRLGQPAVIGEILTGIILGPSLFGALWPQGFHHVLPAGIMPQLGMLAELGAILFVFLAGLEVDTGLLPGRSSTAVVVSHVSIAFPFLLGIALAIVVREPFAPPGIGFEPFALFMGVSMSVTALPVMARILMDNGMLRSEVGTVALTCALVDDATAWSLLAVVVAFATASSLGGVVLTVTLAICFAFAMIAVVRPAMRAVASTRLAAAKETFLALILASLLLAAFVTAKIGIQPIFGAFIFGLVCPGDLAVFGWVREHLSAVTTTLLLPLFFPVHRSGPVEVAVGAGDEAGGAGRPEESFVRAECLPGPEGQPSAYLDPAAHSQCHCCRQRAAGADGRGQVTLHGFWEAGDFFCAERALGRGTAQGTFPAG